MPKLCDLDDGKSKTSAKDTSQIALYEGRFEGNAFNIT